MVVLLDPSLLEGLSAEERAEALAAAAAAERAEQRAEQRALEAAIQRKEEEEERRRQRRREEETEEEEEREASKEEEAAKHNDKRRRRGVNHHHPTSASTIRAVGSRSAVGNGGTGERVVFVRRKNRQTTKKAAVELANERTTMPNTEDGDGGDEEGSSASNVFMQRANNNNSQKKNGSRSNSTGNDPSSSSQQATSVMTSAWTDRERAEIKRAYLGKKILPSITSTGPSTTTKGGGGGGGGGTIRSNKNHNNKEVEDEEAAEERAFLEHRQKLKSKKKTTFKFQWDDEDDTTATAVGGEDDELYNLNRNTANNNKTKKRKRSNRLLDLDHMMPTSKTSNNKNNSSVLTKPWHLMTLRDWRMIREQFDIVVKGGKTPPPLRRWQEEKQKVDDTTTTTLSSGVGAASSVLSPPNIHPLLLQSIRETLRFETPSPIQRQAIPIGLERRDLIGLAETGSGKTIAFGVPLCHYILHLDPSIIARRAVATHGPLALVLAPTRELALQIQLEFTKLLSFASGATVACPIISVPIVGGQPIQGQAQALRDGVHIVVGTPGRINDCLEMAYLVLNQCCYVVLDEADRMVDMGFAPQIESILDAMGGTLKSESEQEAHRQEAMDKMGMSATNGGEGRPNTTATLATPTTTPTTKTNNQVLTHRLTAMFSATMPPEVERMTQKYLRHPAIISIGADANSRKNARIQQRLVWLGHPAQKEKALRDLLLQSPNSSSLRHRRGGGEYRGHNMMVEDKIIVFCNEKKQADVVGRMIERMHLPRTVSVVLHGGKSQEQREENLDRFRSQSNGTMRTILVATDVAGRGLDIPNVSHVINYDLPSRSIDAYSHRIGRTGRAGKDGLATSLITEEEDTNIMAPLKEYLQATGQRVPERLARHPAAAGVNSFDRRNIT